MLDSQAKEMALSVSVAELRGVVQDRDETIKHLTNDIATLKQALERSETQARFCTA
jgi:hypothetical protein